MAMTTMVHVRVDEQIKTQAAETLAAMGLTGSDAIRVFLTLVVAEKQLPFALKVPNTDTRAAMTEVDKITRKRQARFGTATELFGQCPPLTDEKENLDHVPENSTLSRL